MKQHRKKLFLFILSIFMGHINGYCAEKAATVSEDKVQPPENQMVNFDLKDFSNALNEGNSSAPITLVEFSSVSCNHCASYYTDVYPRIKKEYIDTGIVKVISVHFPYDPLAYLANILFEDLPYAERHSAMLKLFQTQNEWLPKDRSETAIKKARNIIMKILGFSEERVKQCSKNQQKIDADIERIYTITQKYNVKATPSFFINGTPFTQTVTFDNFKNMFDTMTKKG